MTSWLLMQGGGVGALWGEGKRLSLLGRGGKRMDFEFHFWRQNMQDSVTDFIPGMRGGRLSDCQPRSSKERREM